MVQEDDFFRETTLRICGSLQIATALADVFAYFKQHFPIIGMCLSITDDDLSAIRNIALVADNQREFPEEIVPLSKELWSEVQEWAPRTPHIFTADMDERFAALVKLERKAELILPLWIDEKLCGVLTLRATQKEHISPRLIELLIPIRFQVETNCDMLTAWADHEKSTKNW